MFGKSRPKGLRGTRISREKLSSMSRNLRVYYIYEGETIRNGPWKDGWSGGVYQ